MSTAFSVFLDSSQETPPTHSAAFGFGTVVFDSDSETASYVFRVAGLDFGPVTGGPPQTPETFDDVTNAHFHSQVRGVAGPVVFGQIGPAQDIDDLSIVHNDDAVVVQNVDGSWTLTGVWDISDPANVSITNFADIFASATVGSDIPIYWNVHTTEFPSGVIRGQLVTIADDDANVVSGTPQPDLLPALDGDDVVFGIAGNDTIDGGAGNDVLFGGLGDDTIFTGPGNDVVFGNEGNDLIRVTSPADTTTGDRLFGDDGNDTLIGGSGADVMDGGRGNDVLTGNAGADTFVFQNGGAGNDRVTDFDPSEDRVQLVGFDSSFKPLEALSVQPGGIELNLGGGNSVLFVGLTMSDFHADDFLVG